MPNELTEPQHRAIENLIAQGRILEAIKLYRSYKDSSLLEAKNYVDACMADHDLEPSQLQTGTITHTQNQPAIDEPEDVWMLIEANIFAGRKIAAVKLARETFGVGLKEAKQMVDEHEQLLRAKHPEKFQSSGAGCSVQAAAFLLAIGVATWLIFG